MISAESDMCQLQKVQKEETVEFPSLQLILKGNG
jgi:hypothetical protein